MLAGLLVLSPATKRDAQRSSVAIQHRPALPDMPVACIAPASHPQNKCGEKASGIDCSYRQSVPYHWLFSAVTQRPCTQPRNTNQKHIGFYHAARLSELKSCNNQTLHS
jgi:hypothetical protein